MKYRYSQTDVQNRNWFNNNNTVATLSSVSLRVGSVRGLFPFDLTFKYPISTISGENGSGKSTILAMVACAFHNQQNGYHPPSRQRPYYTFSDFFIQSLHEVSVDGVDIWYGIRHDNWHRKDPGMAFQNRIKRKGGRWNNYHSRVKRNVIYFGVQRVVPHFERSAHRSYRRNFKPSDMPDDVRNEIANIVSRIFGREYKYFDNYQHYKYFLPQVNVDDIWYSGFNMGSGEVAIFEIISSIFKAGRGTLIVVDEIELGLHESAQRRFIEELKQLCLRFFCQIICSTHSHTILNSLPPESRFFVENTNSKTILTEGISADFACGKMGKLDAQELDIFVEDTVSKSILEAALPLETRRRVNIIEIGSSGAVIRQLTARYLERVDNCICVLDGDQKAIRGSVNGLMARYAELSTEEKKELLSSWADERIFFLPGDVWPEKWLIDVVVAHIVCEGEGRSRDGWGPLEGLVRVWGLRSIEELRQHLAEANRAGKHIEMGRLSELVCVEVTRVRSELITAGLAIRAHEVQVLVSSIEGMLA